MKQTPFSLLTTFERVLWLYSLAVTVLSFAISGGGDIFTMIASLIGVTALIFVVKGFVIGQVLGRLCSRCFTDLCMTAPNALFSVISRLRHPYTDGRCTVFITGAE